MSSILLPILIASFIGYQLDELKMKKYNMINQNGENIKVQFSKNGKYSCPLNCNLHHYHYATISNDLGHSDNLWNVDISIDQYGFNRYEINGITMDSYTVFKATKKIPKQSMPIAFNNSQNN